MVIRFHLFLEKMAGGVFLQRGGEANVEVGRLGGDPMVK
jgi:hypothetical protein